MRRFDLSTDGLVRALEAIADTIEENKEYLTELDAAIGDADHGINMSKGFTAVRAEIPAMSAMDPAQALKKVAMILLSKVGGASGPLYGSAFLRMSQAASQPGCTPVSLFEAGVQGIRDRGKAEPGDKTMLDTLEPALEAMKAAYASGKGMDEVSAMVVEAARKGMESTKPLVARKGRASYLGQRSADHIDPGATSSYLIIKAAFAARAGGE
ncbi:MAG: dihydroxyacetone kinase subunit DhaL [Ignavibacteriales bacterium]